MKLIENDDPKTHLLELKQHFQLMLQRHDNLIKIGSTMSESCFIIIVMLSLPQFYQLTLQTLTANGQASKLSGLQLSAMKADNLIAFIPEEAQHHVINNEFSKDAESTLAARTKKSEKPKRKKKDKAQSDITCKNCKRTRHGTSDCYQKGGGKEGQAPWNKKKTTKNKECAMKLGEDIPSMTLSYSGH